MEFETKFAEQIDQAFFMWFTTVREDGMPQPTPVWFIQDGDSFLIYSMPTAQKIKNIHANSKVALSWTIDKEADHYVSIMGHATVDPRAPKAIDNAPYMAKYGAAVPGIGMTPESMSEAFSVAIRVLPTRVRGE